MLLIILGYQIKILYYTKIAEIRKCFFLMFAVRKGGLLLIAYCLGMTRVYYK